MAIKRLVYAKALIEITPTKPLPSVFKVRLVEDVFAKVRVRYNWKSDICTSCQSFGHLLDVYSSLATVVTVLLDSRVPLLRLGFDS